MHAFVLGAASKPACSENSRFGWKVVKKIDKNFFSKSSRCVLEKHIFMPKIMMQTLIGAFLLILRWAWITPITPSLYLAPTLRCSQSQENVFSDFFFNFYLIYTSQSVDFKDLDGFCTVDQTPNVFKGWHINKTPQ